MLPTFSKVYKRIVYNQLENFLESNQLLEPEQHVFRPVRSVITVAMKFIQTIVNKVDVEEKVVGIFSDSPYPKILTVCHMNI